MKIENVKLYNSRYAPNARRVRMFLAEKGLEAPFIDVDLAKLEQKTPAYSALNPFQGVPSLEFEDGSVICESVAICRYFEELYPEPPLFGVGARERAEVEMWQRRAELYLFFPVAQAYRHTHPAAKVLESPQIGEWAEVNKGRALENLERFDRELEGRPFLAGDRFSIADITGLCALDFLRPARITLPEGLANVKRWKDALSARPSAAA